MSLPPDYFKQQLYWVRRILRIIGDRESGSLDLYDSEEDVTMLNFILKLQFVVVNFNTINETLASYNYSLARERPSPWGGCYYSFQRIVADKSKMSVPSFQMEFKNMCDSFTQRFNDPLQPSKKRKVDESPLPLVISDVFEQLGQFGVEKTLEEWLFSMNVGSILTKEILADWFDKGDKKSDDKGWVSRKTRGKLHDNTKIDMYSISKSSEDGGLPVSICCASCNQPNVITLSPKDREHPHFPSFKQYISESTVLSNVIKL